MDICSIAWESESGSRALDYIGLVAGTMTALAAAYVIGYVVLGLPARRTLKVAWRPVGAVFALAAMIAAACAPTTISQTKAELIRNECARNMEAIAFNLKGYGELPKDLRAMVADKHLHADQILCPACGKEYFYMPVTRTARLDKMHDTRLNKMLVVCDLARSHPGGRLVIFADWSWNWKTDSEFDELLKLPVNEAFAKELQKAEAQ